jgi:Zn-dependent protease
VKTTKLLRVFGIDIQIHYSWYFIFVLLTWSLSSTFFPTYYPDFERGTHWFMGIIAALLLFVSVLLHELSHSLVAKVRKIKVESITLFFFGGVAGITDEDMKPSSEFLMAMAGPVFSILLGVIFFAINRTNSNLIIGAITFYLYQLNFILAAFNLVPGFPLDGGRAFRAILYGYYKDLRKATKIASMGGKFFAAILVILGVMAIFGGSGGGLWFILIGAFLYFIAGVSYEQVVVRQTLTGLPIAGIIDQNVITLSPQMRLLDLVKKFSSSDKDVFVVKGTNYLGVIDMKLVNKPAKFESVSLQEVALPVNKVKALQDKDNLYTAFKLFSEQNVDLLPVKRGATVVGFASRKLLSHKLGWSLKYGSTLSSRKFSKRLRPLPSTSRRGAKLLVKHKK